MVIDCKCQVNQVPSPFDHFIASKFDLSQGGTALSVNVLGYANSITCRNLEFNKIMKEKRTKKTNRRKKMNKQSMNYVSANPKPSMFLPTIQAATPIHCATATSCWSTEFLTILIQIPHGRVCYRLLQLSAARRLTTTISILEGENPNSNLTQLDVWQRVLCQYTIPIKDFW